MVEISGDGIVKAAYRRMGVDLHLGNYLSGNKISCCPIPFNRFSKVFFQKTELFLVQTNWLEIRYIVIYEKISSMHPSGPFLYW